DDSFPAYEYFLKIKFIDKSGENKMTEIEYLKNNTCGPDTYEIKESLYSLEVVKTGKSQEDLFLNPLCVQKANENDRLVLTTTTCPLRSNYRPTQLTHKLVCSSIFGDQEE